jgi:YggT family protein
MLFATLVTIVVVIQYIAQIYIYIVIAAVIMSWLLAMGTLNMRNEFVRSVVRILDALTEPVFRLVRRVIPTIGPLDLSPMVVIIALWAIADVFLPTLLGRLQMGSFL